MNQFQLDIITPTSIHSYSKITYLRIPSFDGLVGIQARHATAIIALDIGEIKMVLDGKTIYFATSGGFSDIRPEGVQLLLETVEEKTYIDKDRAEKALQRAEKLSKDKTMDIDRASRSLKRAKNRIKLLRK